MATITAVLPRVSKVVQEQVVTRIPVRRIRRLSGQARKRQTARRIQRIVVLTAASLALASAAIATAFWLSRRFNARALEVPDGQAGDIAVAAGVALPELAIDGTSKLTMEADMTPLA